MHSSQAINTALAKTTCVLIVIFLQIVTLGCDLKVSGDEFSNVVLKANPEIEFPLITNHYLSLRHILERVHKDREYEIIEDNQGNVRLTYGYHLSTILFSDLIKIPPVIRNRRGSSIELPNIGTRAPEDIIVTVNDTIILQLGNTAIDNQIGRLKTMQVRNGEFSFSAISLMDTDATVDVELESIRLSDGRSSTFSVDVTTAEEDVLYTSDLSGALVQPINGIIPLKYTIRIHQGAIVPDFSFQVLIRELQAEIITGTFVEQPTDIESFSRSGVINTSILSEFDNVDNIVFRNATLTFRAVSNTLMSGKLPLKIENSYFRNSQTGETLPWHITFQGDDNYNAIPFFRRETGMMDRTTLSTTSFSENIFSKGFDELYYDFGFVIKPKELEDQNRENIITQSDSVTISFDIDVPLHSAIENFFYEDDFNVDFSKVDIDSYTNDIVVLSIQYNNHLPLELNTQVYLLSSSDEILDSVFTSGSEIIISGGIVDESQSVAKSTILRKDILLTEEKSKKLIEATKKLRINLSVSTNNNNARKRDPVIFKSTDNIQMSVSAKIKTSINVDF